MPSHTKKSSLVSVSGLCEVLRSSDLFDPRSMTVDEIWGEGRGRGLLVKQ